MEQNKNSFISSLKEFYDSVTLSGLTDRNDLEQLRKIRLMHLLVLTGVVILYGFAIIAFFEGLPLLAVINFLTASILVSLRVYLKKTNNYPIASSIGIIVISIFLLFFYISGGSNQTGHLWTYILPLFTAFLLGSKKGLILTLLFLLLTIISNFFNFSFKTEYSLEFKIRFALSFLTLSLFAYYVELLRENIANRLTVKNNNLNLLIENQKNTELKLIKAKELAEYSSKAKSEFLRNMSHELRTPLNHIIGFSQLIQDGIPGSINDTQKEYLGDILDSSSHLLSLINDLLDIARIESGKVELTPESVDLSKLIRESVEIYQTKASNENLKIILNSGTIPETIMADKRKIVQILYNLLSNAVKFSKKDGLIILSTKTDSTKNEVVISIKDTGIGIEEKNMNLIFDSFGQVESDITRKFEGTGLGLALTKNLVELHGGRIWVKSEGLGMGSTFSFSLPLTQP
ncbi:MAG: hypothetical protein KAH95_07790 [Spirochaetales bacterium]|nr:hypothetical protein [Spirochaetales bacterium]